MTSCCVPATKRYNKVSNQIQTKADEEEIIWKCCKKTGTTKTVRRVGCGVLVLFVGHIIFKTCSGIIETYDEWVAEGAAKSAQEEARQNAEKEFRASVLNSLSISDFEWEIKTNFLVEDNKNVMVVNFMVSNTSDYPIKDFYTVCRIYANSGTSLGQASKPIYDIVKPHSKKAFKNIEMGAIHEQAGRADCKITNCEIVQ